MASVRLVQLTDLHIVRTPGELLYGVDSGAALAGVVADIRTLSPRPHAIILTGDITQDAHPESYLRVKHLLAPLQLPVYAIPGNHDNLDVMRTVLAGEGVAIKTLQQVDGWQCIFLNSTVEGKDHGFINAASLNFLQKTLTENSDRPTLIALHHPPTLECSAFDCQLQNREQLLDAVMRFECVKGMIAGHTHCQSDRLAGSMQLMVTPSTFLHVTHHSKDPATDHSDVRLTHTIDGSRRAYRVLDLLEDGTLATEVRWVAP